MKKLIVLLKEEIENGKVNCDGCGWSWKLSDGGNDKYICHKCGTDNSPKQSNFDRTIDELIKSSNSEYVKNKSELIKNYVKDYVKKSNYVIKFINSCQTGFMGVRTKNKIIICSPSFMQTLGDFIYTIFHEIRHEQQVSEIKMSNPLIDFDLEDFENLYKQYWEMELDADQFAKNMVANLVYKLKIPIEDSKKVFTLSPYTTNYPSMSKNVEHSIKSIIETIKKMKKDGIPYEDIIDHPFVKKHLDKLEDFI